MIYGTYGENCEHFRFKKIGRNAWQRVKRFLIFWIAVGKPFRDSDEMFYQIKSNSR